MKTPLEVFLSLMAFYAFGFAIGVLSERERNKKGGKA